MGKNRGWPFGFVANVLCVQEVEAALNSSVAPWCSFQANVLATKILLNTICVSCIFIMLAWYMYVQLDCYLLLLLDSCIYSLVYFWTLFDGSSGVCLMICSTFICISFISMNKVLIQCIDAHPIAAYRTKNHSIISRGGKGPKNLSYII